MNKRPRSVRITATAHGTYQLDYYLPGGKRQRMSCGKDRGFAEQQRRRVEEWLWSRLDPREQIAQKARESKQSTLTLIDVYPLFLKRHGATVSVSMRESYRHSYNAVQKYKPIADVPLQNIKRAAVQDYMRERQARFNVSPATVNREIAFLKCVLSRAVEWELIPYNPLHGLRLLRESDQRDVRLTVEQAGTLIAALPPRFADVVEFAIYSGFRAENILSLTIGQIRFHTDNPTAEVDLIVKGNRRETLMIGPLAVNVLRRAIGRRRDGFVFLSPAGDRYHTISRAFHRTVQRLNIRVGDSFLRFHDLRHVYATWLHESGVSLDFLRHFMAHKDRKTTDRYAGFDKRQAADMLNAMPEIIRPPRN